MFNTNEYDSKVQFIKFKSGDTILSYIFYHKKTTRLFVANPMKLITNDKNEYLTVSFVKWLPLADENVLYEIDQSAILTSGTPSDEFINFYMGSTESIDINNDIIN